MSDWIEEKVAKIRQQELKAASDRAWEDHADEVIGSKGRSVLREIRKALQRDIDKWNASFPGDTSRVIECVKESDTQGITIEKLTPPTAVANIQFDPVALGLQITFTHAPSLGGEGYPELRKLHLHLAKDETIYFTGHTSAPRISYDHLSRMILEAMIDGALLSI